MRLRTTPADPRYANHIDEKSSYRVDFWTRDAASGGSKEQPTSTTYSFGLQGMLTAEGL
ncbi:hypothetical protein [Cryobacterium melibiosiphilum]|nr:hypothetical protein [Cryobacterium melibiosiphilum]